MHESNFQIEFDAGHLVVDAHRHHFRVWVRCAGELDTDGPTRGMVVDFRVLSKLLDSKVRCPLEGYMLVDENDLQPGWERIEGLPVKAVPFRPTVEHLAQWCFDEVTGGLAAAHAAKVASVEVWENDRCMAAYRP